MVLRKARVNHNYLHHYFAGGKAPCPIPLKSPKANILPKMINSAPHCLTRGKASSPVARSTKRAARVPPWLTWLLSIPKRCTELGKLQPFHAYCTNSTSGWREATPQVAHQQIDPRGHPTAARKQPKQPRGSLLSAPAAHWRPVVRSGWI